ncbi:MAG: NUDIX hydrolase [Wujia sp.]
MVEFTRNKLELMYTSKIVEVYKDYLKTPDGTEVVYDYIKHRSGGGAGVLLVDDRENTYLVRQYRNSIDAVDIEIPAGGYAYVGEPGDVCARREAEEEVGYIPNNLYHIANIVSSIGTFDERTDIYIGTDLTKSEVHYDPDEYIEILYMSIDEAVDKIYKGEIIDSKTVTALLAYKDLKNRGIIK